MKPNFLSILILLLFPFFYLYGNIIGNTNTDLKDSNPNSITKILSPNSSADIIITNSNKYGMILTDGKGYTLYFFTKDNDTSTSNCNGQCDVIWPVFYADTLKIGTGLNEEDFGNITRSDNSHQVTYKGWPLYYYSGDSAPGDVNGENFAGVWFVAKPNYTIMLMNNQLVGNDGVEYNSHYQPGQEIVQYLTDGYGRTLYYFTHDTFNKNIFTKSDFSNNSLWPIFEDSLQVLPSVMDSSNFGTIDVFGHKQLTYKGWPLYHFGPDSMKRGNTKGISFPSPGIWPVAQSSIKNAPKEVMITSNTKYGNILTDGTGNILYFFTKDTMNSDCNGQCAIIWPTFYTDSLIIGAGLKSGDFGTIMRADSLMQITYKGWPLYYYSGDAEPGDVNGEGFKGIWFVAKPDYTIMLMNNQLVGNDGIDYNSNYQPGQEDVQYFVDGYGRTLYIFTHDTFDKNNFTKSDFSNNSLWPIFEDSLKAVPSAIDTNYFGMINVFGHTQLTYKGWPLYQFGPDSMKRGNTKGVSFPSPGVWPVAQISIDSATITGIKVDKSLTEIPHSYSLSQNYPNPFNPSTNIKFSIINSENVALTIYNSLGQTVKELLNRVLPVGVYNVKWDAENEPSGIYFYSISTDHFKQTKKMILLK
ncbi:MAG: T9SS type A sorting domain-containing protein [Ignavibacteriaceae bacterium]